MGKTVTTPCAWLDPPPTRNPWNLERTPEIQFGFGGGSGLWPGCGRFGNPNGRIALPSGGLLRRCALNPPLAHGPIRGILPLSLDLDHPGPMARFLQTWSKSTRFFSGWKRPQVSPNAMRLGVPQECLWRSAPNEIQVWMRSTLSRLQASGIVLDPIPLPSEFGQLSIPISHLMAFGAWQTHRHKFSQTPEIYPPRIRELILKGADLDPIEVDRARGLACGFAKT